MFEVVGAFGWPELFQDDCEGVADCVEGSRGGTSEQRLEPFDFAQESLGEDQFDGPFDFAQESVEVGTVGREIEQPHPGIFKALPDARHLMRGEIVGDDDAAWGHFGDEAFLEPLLEDLAGHGARDQLRSKDAVMLEARHQGRCHPVTMRRLCQQFSTHLAPTMCSDHARCRAGVIDEHQ